MIRYFSLFSGIGAFEKGLGGADVDFELVGYSEIDKYASKSYSAIHGVNESLNYGDITKINEKALPHDIDLISYGFPCQDISSAGKAKGLFNTDGSITRSGLFFEALRIIKDVQPRIAIAENVKNLVGKKFKEQFKLVLDSLDEAGYNNYFKVLNSTDFGIPQNRERVFIVSIRKDIDTGLFQFPQGFHLEKRLKDFLEDDVDEKFFIKSDLVEKRLALAKAHPRSRDNADYEPKDGYGCYHIGSRDFILTGFSDISYTLAARDYKDAKCVCVKRIIGLYDKEMIDEDGNQYTERHQIGSVFDSDGLCPTLDTSGGGNRQPMVIVEPNVLTQKRTEYGKQIRKQYENGEIEESWSNMKEFVPREDGICNTLSTVQKDNMLIDEGLRIRRLTPKEYFRLQNFSDEDFEKASAVCSNTQLYKQAGNSITVSVAKNIFLELKNQGFLEERKEEKQMELKVNEYSLPSQITFNFEELKAELEEKVSVYSAMVYTDDQVKIAKADKANLNKLKKALNDERIRMEREYMVPFNAFKEQISEIMQIIDKPILVIDNQIKDFDEKRKAEKLKEISDRYLAIDRPNWLNFTQIFEDKWLNASESMNGICSRMEEKIEQINKDMQTLENLPNFAFESMEIYKSTLDMNKALNEANMLSEIQKKKEEFQNTQAEKLAEQMEQKKLEEVMNPPIVEEEEEKMWVDFSAHLTVSQAKELKEFFEARRIEFRAI